MQEYDVIVAGGGTAGVAAAVSAARAGARTLLVERTAVLGGQAPIALVHSICGLYHLADDGPPRFANNGFAEEFATRLIARGGAHGPEKMGRVWVLLTRPTAVAELASTMARETPGLDVRLETEVRAASEQNLTLSGAGLRHVPEKSVSGNCFVDATGDGALAAMLGAEFEQECRDRLQRPAYIFGIEGAPAVLDDEARLRLARRIVSAVKDGTLPAAALGATLRSTAPLGEVFVSVDLSAGPAYEPTSEECVDALNAEGRVLADSIVDFLRGQIAGFENCRISQVPARIGIRESRRIAGQYRIETSDVESGASFDDAVALAAWPMELRETNRGPRLRYPFTDQPCDIPLRALRFRDHPHCFSAGRCISASHEAHASLRVIGTCLATGEAAGFAAAMMAESGSCNAAEVWVWRQQSRP